MSANATFDVHESKQALADASGAALVAAIADTLAERDVCHVALTGGSMGSAILASAGAAPGADELDWSRVHLWWGDERYLPAGDPDRNQTQNGEALLDRLSPAPFIHAVAGPDTSDSAEASAQAYAQELSDAHVDAFDVLLLGVGPDAHIASLFPHHEAQRTTGSSTTAVHDSPKPPPDRVSLTFERLNASRQVWFLVAGADKADAVAAATADDADRWDTPASGVLGTDRTIWWLDADAASTLNRTSTTTTTTCNVSEG